VEPVAAAIEHHVGDAGRNRARRHQLADLDGRRDIAPGLELPAQVLFQARGGNHRLALPVVDDLGVNVLVGPEHRKTRLAASPKLDLVPHALLAPLEQLF